MNIVRGLACAVMVLLCAPGVLPQSNPPQRQAPPVHLAFTTIDVPGAGYSYATGINTAGDIVGVYGQDSASDAHGYLYKNGAFTYFDYPGETVTVALGINVADTIVGHAGQFPVYGFLYDGSGFSTLQDGSDTATFAAGINNGGTVVGGAGTIYTTAGFELRNDVYHTINFPGAYVYGYAAGINNFGTIVGFADDSSYIFKNRQFRSIVFPGAVKTTALAINDNGVVAGWYNLGSSEDYAFVELNGKYLSIHYPGAVGTFATGINNSRQIVGEYFLADGVIHGFVTSSIAADF